MPISTKSASALALEFTQFADQDGIDAAAAAFQSLLTAGEALKGLGSLTRTGLEWQRQI